MSKFKGKYYREHCYSRFTKDLVRRSRSRCELCGQGNHRLSIMELEPLTPEPTPENSLFLCDSCIKQINDPKNESPSLAIFIKNYLVRSSSSTSFEYTHTKTLSTKARSLGNRIIRFCCYRRKNTRLVCSGRIIT